MGWSTEIQILVDLKPFFPGSSLSTDGTVPKLTSRRPTYMCGTPYGIAQPLFARTTKYEYPVIARRIQGPQDPHELGHGEA